MVAVAARPACASRRVRSGLALGQGVAEHGLARGDRGNTSFLSSSDAESNNGIVPELVHRRNQR